MKRRSHQNNELENEDNKDMLSDLPDCVLLHIMSLLNARDAVQTCLLSTRWKHLWKHLSTLNLSVTDFRNALFFTEFVNQILSRRNSSTTVLNTLNFRLLDWVEPHLLKRMLPYVLSQDVNHLCLSLMYQIPPSLFSSHSLTSLDIVVVIDYPPVIFPISLNLPALVHLKLRNLSFHSGTDGRIEPFSTFNSLKTLFLHNYIIRDAQRPLCISSTTLLNLSIDMSFSRHHHSNIELFAPSLCTFDVIGNSFQKLSGSHLYSIKQVRIDVYHVMYPLETTLDPLNWLIEMTNIESLNVTPNILQALSLVPDILKLKLPSLCNLKSLNLYLVNVITRKRDIKMQLADGKSWKESAKLRETIKAELKPVYSSILDGMIEFLLQNSPSAKVDIMLGS